jgi:penicillin-binding protein 1A
MKIPASVKAEADKSEDIGVIQNGNPFTKNLSGKQVYDPRLAYVMTSLLKGVITSGTGSAARELGPNVAGKTGTTNDFIDAWFVGYTPNVVTAVWAGFDDNKTLGYGETGGRSPIGVWKEYMRATIRKFGDDFFEVPAGISQAWVDKKTGKKAPPNTSGAILESFAESVDTGVDEAGIPKATRPLGDDEYFENQ